MNWIWLNIPLGSLIFLAVAGIPMWLVIKRPDARPDRQAARRAALRPARVPVQVAAGPRARTASGERWAEEQRMADRLVSAR